LESGIAGRRSGEITGDSADEVLDELRRTPGLIEREEALRAVPRR